MRSKTDILKKSLAFVLAVVIALPTACITAFAADGPVSVTAGELVAANFDSLTDEEKAVLTSGYVAGGTFDYHVPAADDNIVAVDPAAKTITAQTIALDGYTWTPVSAAVIYSGGQEDVALDNAYTGTFAYAGAAYKVDVTYSAQAAVDAAVQTKLLNGPYYLAKTLGDVEDLYNNLGYFSTISQNADYLRSLVNLGLDTPATVAAINAFANQTAANNGFLDIEIMLTDYEEADSAVKYMLENGAALKAKAIETYNYIEAIEADKDRINELRDKASSGFAKTGIRVAMRALEDLSAGMAEAVADDWAALTAANNPLKANLTAAEYQALDDLVFDVLDNIPAAAHTDAAKTALSFDDVVVSVNVSQYNVTVNINAVVIADATVDSPTPTALPTHTVVLQVAENASATEIMDAIIASGIEDTAKADWGCINDTTSVKDTSALPATLTSDIVYNVSYLPANRTVTYDFATTLPANVPYGYNMTLPVHEGTELVYDYYIGGTHYFQGTVITITENIGITRTEGKPWSVMTKDQVVTNVYSDVLTDAEKAIIDSVVTVSDDVLFRVPTNDDGLVTVTLNASNKYEVAAANYESGLVGLVWTPVEATINGTTKPVTGGVAEFDAVVFDSVSVKYQLATGDTLMSAADVQGILNLPKTLSDDAKSQTENMNFLYNRLYNRLSELDGKTLNQIRIGVRGSDMSDDAKAAAEYILSNCVNEESNNLYLYDHLTAYRAQGLSYYYKDGNYADIRDQVNVLKEKLNVIYTDANFQTLLSDIGRSEYYTKIGNIINDLDGVVLTDPNPVIDARSPSLADLVASLNALNNAREFTAADAGRDITLTTSLTAPAPGKAIVNVTVEKQNSIGQIVKSETTVVVTSSAALDADDVTNITAAVNNLKNSVGIDTVHYEAVEPNLSAGDPVANVKVTYAPKQYMATIKDETGADITTVDFSFDRPEITLDGCANANQKYRYAIGADEVTVETQPKNYTFTAAQIDAGDYVTIVRTTVDPYKEALIALIDDINQGIIDAGMVDGSNNATVAFIPVEDANGNISIVLRISPKNLQKNKIKKALTAVAEAIMGTDYKYIGIGTDFLREDDKVSAQSVINTVLNSGINLDTIINAIDKNGDVNEMTLAGAPVNAVMAYDNGQVNDTDVYGAKIMETPMVFGTTASRSDIDATLYITLEDFDLRADDLKNIRRAAKKARNYGNVTAHNGILDVNVTVPDRAYQAYLTALLALGDVTLDDLNAIEFDNLVDLALDIIYFVADDLDITTETLENTADKLGREVELSRYSKYYDKAHKALKRALEKATITINGTPTENSAANGKLTIDGTTTANSYSADVALDLTAVYDYVDLQNTYRNIIKEDSVTGKFKLTINNTADYDAIVIDAKASGTGKLVYTHDLAASLADVHNNTIIILLRDYNGTLTTNKNVFIDLNGHIISGDLVCNGRTVVVDSKLDTNSGAGVTGQVSGNAILTGGSYNPNYDITSMLKGGYVVENNIVRNGYYYITDDGNGNIDVHLTPSSDVAKTTDRATVKAMAVEVLADVALNYFTAAAAEANGKEIYAFEIDDVVRLLDRNERDAQTVNELLDCINCDNIKDLANDLLDELCDLTALSNKIKNNTAVASYTIVTNPWTFELEHITNGDYLSALVKADDTRQTTQNVNVYVDENGGLSDTLEALGEIMTIDAEIEGLSIEYDNSVDDFTGEISGWIEVEIDMTKDPEYPKFAIAIAVILADGLDGAKKAALTDAINDYYATGATASLKAAIEDVTTEEFFEVFGSDTPFETMLSNLGLDGTVSDEVTTLYNRYRKAIIGITKVINKSDKWHGSNSTLGSLETAEYGVYKDGRTNTSYTVDREVYDDYGASATATITRADVTVKLFKPIIRVKDANDTLVYVGDDLEDAYAEAHDGYTVEVLGAVSAEENIDLPYQVTMTGTEYVTFGNYKINLTDLNAQLTADKQITSYVASGINGYDVREDSVSGNYVYTLIPKELILGISLSLEDEIRINCYIADLGTYNADELTFKYTFKGVETTAQQLPLTFKEIVASCAAKEMTEVCAIRVYQGTSIVKSLDISIRKYCEDRIANPNASNNERELCHYVLNYGTEAQNYFEYKTDDLATRDAGLYKDGKYYDNTNTEVNIDASYKVTAKTGDVSLGASLNTEYRTEINIYDYSNVGFGDVLDADNQVYNNVEIDGNKLTISGIAARELNKEFTVQFGNGATFKYSALSYVYDRINNNRDDADVCKAIFNYYLAAVTYFSNRNG